MSIQDPPMILYFHCKKGDPFNKDLFSEYRISGKTFAYLVWPAVLLCHNGVVMKKGVAQPKKKSVGASVIPGAACNSVGVSADTVEELVMPERGSVAFNT